MRDQQEGWIVICVPKAKFQKKHLAFESDDPVRILQFFASQIMSVRSKTPVCLYSDNFNPSCYDMKFYGIPKARAPPAGCTESRASSRKAKMASRQSSTEYVCMFSYEGHRQFLSIERRLKAHRRHRNGFT